MYALAIPPRQRHEHDRYRKDAAQSLLRGKEIYAPPMSSPYFYEWLAAIVSVNSLERPIRIEFDERTGQHVAMIERAGE